MRLHTCNYVCSHWCIYITCICTKVYDKFSKYDKDKSGILSREEVRAMLTELNDGIRVSDEESLCTYPDVM